MLNKTVLGMAVVAVILALKSIFPGGLTLVGRASGGRANAFGIFPCSLLLSWWPPGSTLIPKMVSRWLGREAGWKGPLLGR